MFLGEVVGGLGGGLGMLSLGFLVGLVHAFEPDHVAAMLTQVQDGGGKGGPSRAGLRLAALRSSVLGGLWGFGHTSMVVLVSVLVFALAYNVPSAVFDRFEFVVGVVLVVLGIYVYRNSREMFGPEHAHGREAGHTHTHKSYLIGCLHGLAGSGGLIVAKCRNP